MDVDAAPGQLRRQTVGENLHVAGEDDQIGPGLADDVTQLLLLLELGALRDGQVMERNSVEVQMRIGREGVVRDDAADVHLDLADAPAVEQVGEAVVEVRSEEHTSK